MTGLVTHKREDRTRIRWMVRLAAVQGRFGDRHEDMLVWEVVPYISNAAGARFFGEQRGQFPYRALKTAHTHARALVAEYRRRWGP